MSLDLDDLTFLSCFSLVGLSFPNKGARAGLLAETRDDLNVPMESR